MYFLFFSYYLYSFIHCYIFFLFFICQDYLGAFIVFVAIATALCSVHLLPDNGSSIVGLAINYTLLIPIYLNWVVKLFADMEMYFGACERISFYIDSCYHETNNNKIEMCKFSIIFIVFIQCYYIMMQMQFLYAYAFYTIEFIFFYYFILFSIADATVPISWPQYGKIVFENVSLKYENQDDNIISNLNLCIPTGQRVRIHINQCLIKQRHRTRNF